MKGLNIIIGFVAGTVCGAGGMWFGMKQRFEKKAEQKVSEARRVFHKMLKQARENSEPNNSGAQTLAQKDASGDWVLNDIPTKTKVEKEPVKRTYDRLGKRFGIKIPTGSVNTENIHEIPRNDFGNINYPGQKLIWFVNENLLVDPLDGKTYDEVEELCGDEGTEVLCAAEVDDFFIRNHELGLDIHVVINYEDHYYEMYPAEG